jgi:hypothetical protein
MRDTRLNAGLIALAGIGFGLVAPPTHALAASCSLAAETRPASVVVLPGQPVDVTLRLRNATSATVSLVRPSERRGNVRASVADQTAPGRYLEYEGPGWGLTCARGLKPLQLAAGGVVTLPLRVMHQADANADPDTSIVTPFAFSTPGNFLLKVDYLDELSCGGAGVSAVVSVRVLAPQGDDLTVWNAIKDCGACALLLHTGRVNTKRAVEVAALAKLRDLATRYPGSGYAPLLRQTIDAIDHPGNGEDNQGQDNNNP